jgi:hypothetical protein
MMAMNQLNATPYLSEMKEQNALMREQNRSLDAQNQIFKTFLRYTSPGVYFEGDDVYTILKSLYINGSKLHDLLSRGERAEGPPLERAKELCNQLIESIDKLSELLPVTNYFHKDYSDASAPTGKTHQPSHGINKILYTDICPKIISWTSWGQDKADETAASILQAYNHFSGIQVAKVLGAPESWRIAG